MTRRYCDHLDHTNVPLLCLGFPTSNWPVLQMAFAWGLAGDEIASWVVICCPKVENDCVHGFANSNCSHHANEGSHIWCEMRHAQSRRALASLLGRQLSRCGHRFRRLRVRWDFRGQASGLEMVRRFVFPHGSRSNFPSSAHYLVNDAWEVPYLSYARGNLRDRARLARPPSIEILGGHWMLVEDTVGKSTCQLPCTSHSRTAYYP